MRNLLLMLLLSLSLSIASTAHADVEGLTLLDQVQGEATLGNLSEPILGDDGAAYWSSSGGGGLGSDFLMSESGPLATETRTLAEPGDFPLNDKATDARGSTVLLSGTYYVPSGGGGYQSTDAIYAFPGLVRRVFYGSTFPGFTSDGLRVTSRAFLDADNSVVFRMRQLTTYAICRESGGTITILAQTGVTTVPGGNGGAFTLFENVTVDDNVILFYGEGGGRRGVYQLVGSAMTMVVDDQTFLPGSTAFITDSSDISFANDGLDIAVAMPENGGGVWKRIGGQWSQIIARNTPIPDGTGNFFAFYAPAIRDQKVVFLGVRDNQFAPPLQYGIYTDAFGGVTRVVDLSTPFLYATPNAFDVADGGRWFDGTDIVFAVQGTAGDDWRALYRATPVPEPGALLAGIAALLPFAAAAKHHAARRRRSVA